MSQSATIFTPNPNQAAVHHLIFTVTKTTPAPDGSLILHVVSGNIGTRLRIAAAPNRPEFNTGADYCVEFARGSNPLTAPITAIYPKSQKPSEKTMNTLVPVAAINTLTITSREIAELTSKQHKHVMRDIRALIDAIKQSPNLDYVCKTSTYTGFNEQKYEQYELDKDTCLTLLLGYDPVARMKVVKRWQELEAGNATPAIPQTLPEALRLAADLAEDKAALTQQVQALEPKAQALDRIATASGSLCITNAAKSLNIAPKKLFDWLQTHRWIYRRAGGKSWTAYQERIQSGCLEHKITTVSRSDGSEKVVEQVLITAKGITTLSAAIQPAAA